METRAEETRDERDWGERERKRKRKRKRAGAAAGMEIFRATRRAASAAVWQPPDSPRDPKGRWCRVDSFHGHASAWRACIQHVMQLHVIVLFKPATGTCTGMAACRLDVAQV